MSHFLLVSGDSSRPVGVVIMEAPSMLAGGPNMLIEHISRVIDESNALAPDLVVLLGDYVAHHRFVTEHVPPAVRLKLLP
jgi:hypothetical protein